MAKKQTLKKEVILYGLIFLVQMLLCYSIYFMYLSSIDPAMLVALSWRLILKTVKPFMLKAIKKQRSKNTIKTSKVWQFKILNLTSDNKKRRQNIDELDLRVYFYNLVVS